MISVTEMAKILNVSEMTIYRLIKAGKLPAYKIGGQYRMDKEEVMRVIRKDKVGKVRKAKKVSKVRNVGKVRKVGK